MRLPLFSYPAFAAALVLLAACGGSGSTGSQSMNSSGDSRATMPDGTGSTDDPDGVAGPAVSFPTGQTRSERAAAIRDYAGGDAPALDAATSPQRVLAVVESANAWATYGGERATAPGSLAPGVCDSTGCGSVTAAAFAPDLFSSQELLPVMVKDGVNVQLGWYTSAAMDEMGAWLFEGSSFGGLLEHGYFYANELRFAGQAPAISVYAIGTETGATPAAGTATWSGAVTGFDADGWVYGDASLRVDFADTTVDVAFSRLVGLTEAAPTYDVAAWTDLPLVDGAFQDADSTRSIEGSFYGPSGEEAGGIFLDLGEGVGGAFGAVRD
ncbi:MAG: transferrin-binding protein-like solute binding protein [Gammaproteobacteria bacterium]|nr:transferrin-binding protein-like solute binding protein [Gammaproteobacteria bacterium]